MNKVIPWLLTIFFVGSVAIAEAQQPTRIPKIGVLNGGEPSSFPARIQALREGLRELGYVEGNTIIIEWRFAEGKPDRLSDLAAELVSLKVDALVTSGTPTTRAAKNATTSIPIVFTGVLDPVGNELVAGLARPGGNLTGMSLIGPELSGKRLELLKEAFPKITRIAVLWNAASPVSADLFEETKVAAQALRIQLHSAEVRSNKDFEYVLAAIGNRKDHALITIPDLLTNLQARRIIEFAAKMRLPAIYDVAEPMDLGGLMGYGANRVENYRKAATYVDKILKGAKPADLPVQQPTKFDFVINLKTAKQFGLTIPPNVLARANKVIK